MTGIALKHNLKPVYLKIEGTEAGVPAAIRLSHRRRVRCPDGQSLHRRELDENSRSLRLRQIMNRKLSCSM